MEKRALRVWAFELRVSTSVSVNVIAIAVPPVTQFMASRDEVFALDQHRKNLGQFHFVASNVAILVRRVLTHSPQSRASSPCSSSFRCTQKN